MSEIPADLKYTKDHEWARAAGKDVTIGITKFASNQLGEAVMVEIAVKVGATIDEGDAFGTIESVKAVSELFAPISGTVKKINEALTDSPELANEDPYGKGWMLVIEAKDGALGGLMDATAYAKYTSEESA